MVLSTLLRSAAAGALKKARHKHPHALNIGHALSPPKALSAPMKVRQRYQDRGTSVVAGAVVGPDGSFDLFAMQEREEAVVEDVAHCPAARDWP